MVRSAQGSLIRSLVSVREDLLTIIKAGVEAAGAASALSRALADRRLHAQLTAKPFYAIAVGKAAGNMAAALSAVPDLQTRAMLAIGTHLHVALPDAVEWHQGSHPLPDERSIDAAARALDLADKVLPDESLLVLLSGGASALMARPLDGISLQEKQQVVATMLRGGADIHALNTVRKHLSAVKGGRLAAACRGRTVTLAVSDVVGDDLAVIGSGPAVPDPSTWADASRELDRYVVVSEQPTAVRAMMAKGVSGDLPDTPKAGDEAMARAEARVIAGRADAMRGARDAAEALGYRTVTIDAPVTGESRAAAATWWDDVGRHALEDSRICVISSGETTVRVIGTGRGGRNQEFALALVRTLSRTSIPIAASSVGTDGIDGPTDAAGAIVDSTTLSRAVELGIVEPERYLANNDSHAYFDALGDLVRLGPTGTNVGDLQILLRGLPPS